MANKFLNWIDNITTDNVKTFENFSNNTQRINGFTPGTIISSSLVNSSLRQANLISCALMNIVATDNQTLDLRSSVEDVKAVMEEGLKNIKVNNSVNSDHSSTSDDATNAVNATKVVNAKVLKQASLNSLTQLSSFISSHHNIQEIVLADNIHNSLICKKFTLKASGITVEDNVLVQTRISHLFRISSLADGFASNDNNIFGYISPMINLYDEHTDPYIEQPGISILSCIIEGNNMYIRSLAAYVNNDELVFLYNSSTIDGEGIYDVDVYYFD